MILEYDERANYGTCVAMTKEEALKFSMKLLNIIYTVERVGGYSAFTIPVIQQSPKDKPDYASILTIGVGLQKERNEKDKDNSKKI